MKGQCCLHIETNQLISTVNQLTGFYMMETLIFIELNSILVGEWSVMIKE